MLLGAKDELVFLILLVQQLPELEDSLERQDIWAIQPLIQQEIRIRSWWSSTPDPQDKRAEAVTYYLRNNLCSYLSGHRFHHILGGLWVLEGLEGPGDLEALADHSLLDPLAEGQCSQGALEARGVLATGRRQKILSVKDKPVCWLPGSFLREVIEWFASKGWRELEK